MYLVSSFAQSQQQMPMQKARQTASLDDVFKKGGDNYETVGSIARNIYSYLQSGKNPEFSVDDRINLRQVPAKHYFAETFNRIYVRRKMLPFSFDVFCAYIKKDGQTANKPIFEFGELDFRALEEVIKEDFKDSAEIRGKSIYSASGEKLLQTQTSERYVKKGEYTRRTNVVLCPNYSDIANADLAIRLLDSIWGASTFNEDSGLNKKKAEIAGTVAVNPGVKLELRQELALQQLLHTVQVPLLQQQQNLYQKQTAEILHMTAEELAVKSYPLMRRMAIARIKSASPEISWEQAQRVYYRILGKTRGR